MLRLLYYYIYLRLKTIAFCAMADREVLEEHVQVNERVKCEAGNYWGLNSGSIGGKTHFFMRMERIIDWV